METNPQALFKNNRIIGSIDKSLSIFVHHSIILLEKLSFGKFSTVFQKIKNNSTLFDNVIGLTFFNALGGIIIIFTQVKIANVIGPSSYGIYTYCLAIGEVGSVIVRYGRSKTMLRDLIQKPEKRNVLISSTLCASFINLFIFLIIVLSFQQILNYPLSLGCILLIIAPCLISLDFQPVYESIMAMSWQSIYNLLQKAIFVSLIWIVLFLNLDITLEFLGCATFISWIIIIIGQYIEISKLYNLNIVKESSFIELKSLYKTNFVIAISTSLGVAFGPAIRIILDKLSNSEEVGIFSAGLQVMLISQFILNQISRVGNPMMAEIGNKKCSSEKRKLFLKRYLSIMIISTLPFFIPLFFAPKIITEIMFTNEYSQLQYMLPYLAIYLLALSIGVVYSQFLISMRKDKIYFIIYIVTAIISILLAILIIPKYKSSGAVIALCIPHSVACIIYWLVSRKLLHNNE